MGLKIWVEGFWFLGYSKTRQLRNTPDSVEGSSVHHLMELSLSLYIIYIYICEFVIYSLQGILETEDAGLGVLLKE